MDLVTIATKKPGGDIATAHITPPMENSIHANLRRMNRSEDQNGGLLAAVSLTLNLGGNE